MSTKLTAEPGTRQFMEQLLAIAQESDHPMDKALTRVISRQLEEAPPASPEVQVDHRPTVGQEKERS